MRLRVKLQQKRSQNVHYENTTVSNRQRKLRFKSFNLHYKNRTVSSVGFCKRASICWRKWSEWSLLFVFILTLLSLAQKWSARNVHRPILIHKKDLLLNSSTSNATFTQLNNINLFASNVDDLDKACIQFIYMEPKKCCLDLLVIEHLSDIGFFHIPIANAQNVPFTAMILDPNRFDIVNPKCPNVTTHRQGFGKVQSNRITLNLLWSKRRLYDTIKSFAVAQKLSHDFLPITFRMDIDQQRRAFFQQLPCQGTRHWVFKESNKHRGQGIHLLSNPFVLRQLFWNDSDIQHARRASFPRCYTLDIERMPREEIVSKFEFPTFIDSKGIAWASKHKLVVQEFIQNPFLIHRRKFHLRVFVVVISLSPYIVLSGKGGILIMAAVQYDKSHLNRDNAITNRAVSEQINSNDDWVMSFDQFEQYLKDMNENRFMMYDVEMQIKNIIKVTFSSVITDQDLVTKIKNDQSVDQYSISALDMLLTEEGKVKLLEVQEAPMTSFIPKDCNSLNSELTIPWQCSFGRAMASEIVDIAIRIAYMKMMKLDISLKAMEEMVSHFEVSVFHDLSKI